MRGDHDGEFPLVVWQAGSGTQAVPIARGQAGGAVCQEPELASATLALFVPVSDEEVLGKLFGAEVIDGVRVITVAIGWT